jgi:hypothetical protein
MNLPLLPNPSMSQRPSQVYILVDSIRLKTLAFLVNHGDVPDGYISDKLAGFRQNTQAVVDSFCIGAPGHAPLDVKLCF